jgi:hypothetical protein
MVTVTVDPDGPLALARRRLDDAVRALADPQPVWEAPQHGGCRSEPRSPTPTVAAAGTAHHAAASGSAGGLLAYKLNVSDPQGNCFPHP